MTWEPKQRDVAKSTGSVLKKCQSGGQALKKCLLFLPPPYTMRTYTAHTYQFPSSPWAGAVDLYKGLSAGVQSRPDPCPQRTNERFWSYKYITSTYSCKYCLWHFASQIQYSSINTCVAPTVLTSHGARSAHIRRSNNILINSAVRYKTTVPVAVEDWPLATCRSKFTPTDHAHLTVVNFR